MADLDAVCFLCEGSLAGLVCAGICYRRFHNDCLRKWEEIVKKHYPDADVPLPPPISQEFNFNVIQQYSAANLIHDNNNIEQFVQNNIIVLRALLFQELQSNASNMENEQGKEDWKCYDCLHNSFTCVYCYNRDLLGTKLIRCKIQNCGRTLHPSCLASQGSKSNNMCSAHTCTTCNRVQPHVKCIRCPLAFHIKCTPKSSKFLLKKCLCSHKSLPWTNFGPSLNKKIVSLRRFVPVEIAPRVLPNAVFSGFAPNHFSISDTLLSSIRASMYAGMKPPQFDKLLKNSYKVKTRLPFKDECISCGCKDNCGRNCLNRVTLIECNSKNCSNSECTNRRFTKRNYATALSIKYTGPTRGFGAFSCDAVLKDDLIIEYCGEVINADDVNMRLTEAKSKGEENFYLMEISADVIIDAAVKGNLARFLNHSCNPNCYSQKWQVGDEIRVGLFANQNLPANSELTYDYNFEAFWPEGKERSCCCGGKDCTKIFGKRPSFLTTKRKLE